MTSLRLTSDARPAPIRQLAVAALGGVALGLSNSGRRSALLRIIGVTLIGAALRPLLEERVRRAGSNRRALAFRSAIDIDRPVREVFAFFKDFENLPRVFGGLRSVADYQDGRSHWELYPASGHETLEWDAVVTKYVPNSVIAWESVPNSPVESTGLLRFTALSPAKTHLDVSITYRPMRTDLSDAVHALLVAHPSRRLSTDLEHARFYLESLPPMEVAR